MDVRGLTAKKVYMTNSSNPVDLLLKTVPNSVEIRDQFGSVSVGMPQGFSGSVDMTAEYGKINTTLPVKVKVLSSSEYAVGKVGAGTGLLTIETKSANITVQEK